MNASTKVVALVHTAKNTAQVLLIISTLTLLLLIAAGAGLFHPESWQAGDQLAGTNGNIHIGGAQLAATTGDIHIGSGG